MVRWIYRVNVYLRVRRAVMVGGMSIREAARTFGLHRDTMRKMLTYSVPPGYLPSAESAPKAQAVTLHLRGAWNGPHLRPGLLLSGGGMEEVSSHDPRAGRASGTPDCFTLLLAGHLAGNAPFPPLAEMPTAQPCQRAAEKVSLVPFACSVPEGADDSRPALQTNGIRPIKNSSLKSRPAMTFSRRPA